MTETMTSYKAAPIERIAVQGQTIAYKRVGKPGASPILFLNHLAANLDGCDPLIIDTLAQHFEVYCFDYPGIGRSEGKAPLSVEAMASATISFVRALGLERIHLLGLSLGGFVAQAILAQAPTLAESVILAGTGPAGDRGIARGPRITFYDMLHGTLTASDVRLYLFFPQTSTARARGKDFVQRSKSSQDKPTALPSFLRQLRAVVAWAKAPQQDFAGTPHRVWVVNGDKDRMVPTQGSYALAERLPNATLTIYKGAGHGAIFQEAELFTQQAIAFYKANDPHYSNNKD